MMITSAACARRLATSRASAASPHQVLFTGGGTSIVDSSGKLTQFGLTGQLVYRTVQEAHANGETFPLWATCLGFEMLNVVAAGDPSVLSGGFDSENLTLALNLEDAASSSRLLGSAPKNVVDILTTQTVTMNNHQSGVTPAAFTGNANLTANFNMLSTNKDRNVSGRRGLVAARARACVRLVWQRLRVAAAACVCVCVPC